MTTNPTPEEIIEVAKSGTETGAVKSLTDIRLEKLEARLKQLEAVNAELRAANAELYSFASQVSQIPQPAAAAEPAAAPQQTAAQIVQPQIDEAAVKATEEANLNAVLAELGYRRTSQSSNNDNTPQDGM